MSSRNLNVAYRLTTEGKLFPIKPEQIQEMFVSVNILAFYFIRQKRLYIWVGENAPRELRNQIPVIEGILLKNHPLFTILRHFTLEGFKPETEELLDFLGISAEAYKKKIADFERFKAETTEALELAKSAATDAYKNEDFDKAVEYSNQVLDLAEKLFDGETRKVQEDFIQKILEKQNRTKELRIQNKVKALVEEYKEYDLSNNFDGAKQKLKEIQAVIVSSSDRGLKRKWETEIPSELEIREKAFMAEQEKRLSQEEAIVAANFSEAKSDFEQNLIKEDFPKCKTIIKRLEQLTDKTRDTQTKESHKKAVESSKNRVVKAEEAVQIRSELQQKIPEVEKLIAANQFLDAKQRINVYTETAEKHGLVGIVKSLSKYQDEVENAEKQMGEQQQQINALSEKIELDDEQQDYQSGVDDCDKILALLIVAKNESQITHYNEIKEKFVQKLGEKQKNAAAAQEEAKRTLEDQETAAKMDQFLLDISNKIEQANVGDANKDLIQSQAILENFHSPEQRSVYESKLKDFENRLVEVKAKSEIEDAIKECQNYLEQRQLEQADGKLISIQHLLKEEQKVPIALQFEPIVMDLSQKINAAKEQIAGQKQLNESIEKKLNETSQLVNSQDYLNAEENLNNLNILIPQLQDDAKKTTFIEKQNQLQAEIQKGKEHQKDQESIANGVNAKLQEIPDVINQKNFDQAKNDIEKLDNEILKLDDNQHKQEFIKKIEGLKQQLDQSIAKDNELKQLADEDARTISELDAKLNDTTQALNQSDIQTAESRLNELDIILPNLHDEEKKSNYISQRAELSKKIDEQKTLIEKDNQLSSEIDQKINETNSALQNADLVKADTELQNMAILLERMKDNDKKNKYQSEYSNLSKKFADQKQKLENDNKLASDIEQKVTEADQSINNLELVSAESKIKTTEDLIAQLHNSEQKAKYQTQINNLSEKIKKEKEFQAEQKTILENIEEKLKSTPNFIQDKQFDQAQNQLNEVTKAIENIKDPSQKEKYQTEVNLLREKLTAELKAQEQVKDDPELYPKIDTAIKNVESETQKEFFEDARTQLDALNVLVVTVKNPTAKMEYSQKVSELQNLLDNKEKIHKTRINIIGQQDQIRQYIEDFNFPAAEELIQNSFKLADEYKLENEKEFLIQRQTELVVRKTQFDSWISNYSELKDKIATAKEFKDWTTGLDLILKLEALVPKLHKENELPAIEDEKISFQKQLEAQQKAAAVAAEQSQRELWAKELQVQIDKAIGKKNFIEAKTMCAELINVEEGIKNPDVKSQLSGYIKETSDKIKQGEDTVGAKKRVKEKCETAQKALLEGQLDQAESDLKEAQSIANAYKFEELKPTIEKTQERLKMERLYERLVSNIIQNEREKQHRAGIENCKKIIEILPLVEKQSEESKYQEILNRFNEMGKLAKEKEQQAQEEVKKNLEQMQTIMTVEADVLPTMEDIPIDDILGDLNGSVDKIFDTLSHVLEENRIEIKTEASSNSVLRSASGEVVELQKTSKIENASPAADDPDKASKPVKFAYSSGLDNPFEDAISEAILEDIIPYDYEISEMNIEGAENYGEPQKSTTKDGLSIKWVLHDIPPKQKVAINYDLRQRVARTAIIPLNTQLKIIKTHANLSPLKLEGLYESKLTFKNEFQQSVKGLVFEDIIPQMYIYEVKRPDDEVPIQGEHSAGISVKWNVQKFDANAKALHQYQLLEMFRFEEMKMKIFNIDKEGFSAVNACDAETSYKKYNDIVKLLSSYIK